LVQFSGQIPALMRYDLCLNVYRYQLVVPVWVCFYLSSYVKHSLRLDSEYCFLFLANLSCLLGPIVVSDLIRALSFFISLVPVGLSAWYQWLAFG
jgi:hypothetical protein